MLLVVVADVPLYLRNVGALLKLLSSNSLLLNEKRKREMNSLHLINQSLDRSPRHDIVQLYTQFKLGYEIYFDIFCH